MNEFDAFVGGVIVRALGFLTATGLLACLFCLLMDLLGRRAKWSILICAWLCRHGWYKWDKEQKKQYLKFLLREVKDEQE